MASGPAQPPPPEQPHGDSVDDRAQADERGTVADASERAPVERFGLLTVKRVAKDDGRALILYGHDEAPAKRDDAAPSEPGRRGGQA